MNIDFSIAPAMVGNKPLGDGYLEVRAQIGTKKLVSSFTFRGTYNAENVKAYLDGIFNEGRFNLEEMMIFVAEEVSTKKWYVFVGNGFDSLASIPCGIRRIANNLADFAQKILDTAIKESLQETSNSTNT